MNKRHRLLLVCAAVWSLVAFCLYWSGLGLERYEGWSALWVRAVPLHSLIPLYDTSCLEQPAVVGGEVSFGCRTEFSIFGFAILALLPVGILYALLRATVWVQRGK